VDTIAGRGSKGRSDNQEGAVPADEQPRGGDPAASLATTLTSSGPSTAERPRTYYGWWIVGAAALVNFAYTVQFNSNYGAYVYSMGADLGWSRTALSAGQAIGRIPEALTAVLVGPVVDRHGARWLVGIGAVMMAAAFVALSTVQQIWQLYLYRGVVVSIGGACMGGFLAVTLSNWFVAKRGRALGMLNMGNAAGTAILPVLTAFIIVHAGWRISWVLQGGVLLLLALPAVVLFRRRPEDLGLLPDGSRSGVTPTQVSERQRRRQAESLAADVHWTRTQVLRTPVYWIMTFAYGTAAMAYTATNLHLIPFIEDLGYPLELGAAAVSLRALLAFICSPVWGVAVERLPLRLTQTLPFALQSGAMLAYFVSPTVQGIVLGLVLYGIGESGTAVLQDSVWAHYFGRISLATVRGSWQPMQSLMSAIGPLAMGAAFDVFGGYQISWLVLFVIFALAGGLVQFARRPTPPGATQVGNTG